MSVSSVASPALTPFLSPASASQSEGSTDPSASTGVTTLATLAATPAISSSTSSNWLAEAESGILASESSGGIMGALQSAATGGTPGSIQAFLADSQSNANAFAEIAQSSMQSVAALYAQMASDAGQQAAQQRQDEENALLNPPAQTNYTPPLTLDPNIYYSDGSSLDTTGNILTLSNGTQIDVTTGLPYVDPGSLLYMANGAYLDTQSNILTEPDGTRIDATTGIKVATTA